MKIGIKNESEERVASWAAKIHEMRRKSGGREEKTEV
jgi:hypothetical protein